MPTNSEALFEGIGAGVMRLTHCTSDMGVCLLASQSETRRNKMLANNPLVGTSSPGPGVIGESDTGDGVLGEGETGVHGIGGWPNGAGVRGTGAGGPNTSAPGVGVYGQGGPGCAGVYGRGGVGGFSGTGVIGIGASVSQVFAPVDDVGVFGQCEGGNLSAGVYGLGGGHGADGVRGEANAPQSAGIFGFGFQDGYAGFFFGRVTVTGDLDVSGAKSAVVPFPDGTQHRLYCMESPESWFEDFGTGQLVNGRAQVQLDPGFASVVAANDYHVFLTEYEDNNGLYVTGRTNTGFGVYAKTSPNASGTFSYRVVAKRKDIVAPRFDQVVLRQPPSADRAARRLGADRNP
jgi:hypothetical protein